MTLIIGIRCSDGIVVGADGAATYETGTGLLTVRESMSKLDIVGNQVVVGTSGTVGLGQLHIDRVRGLFDQQTFNKNGTADVLRAVHGAMTQDAHFSSMASFVILAAPVGGHSGRAELIQWAATGPEAATDDLPYFSTGSGQLLADPFLAFIRRVFWPNRSPELKEGIFAVAWTLIHSIGVAPGGIGEPIQLVTLSKGKGNQWAARMLDDQELGECREAVESIEERLPSLMSSDGAPAPPSLEQQASPSGPAPSSTP